MFVERLREAIKSPSFDLVTAEKLSDEMHAAECEGYQVTVQEEHFWLVLTEKIMEQE